MIGSSQQRALCGRCLVDEMQRSPCPTFIAAGRGRVGATVSPDPGLKSPLGVRESDAGMVCSIIARVDPPAAHLSPMGRRFVQYFLTRSQQRELLLGHTLLVQKSPLGTAALGVRRRDHENFMAASGTILFADNGCLIMLTIGLSVRLGITWRI